MTHVPKRFQRLVTETFRLYRSNVIREMSFVSMSTFTLLLRRIVGGNESRHAQPPSPAPSTRDSTNPLDDYAVSDHRPRARANFEYLGFPTRSSRNKITTRGLLPYERNICTTLCIDMYGTSDGGSRSSKKLTMGRVARVFRAQSGPKVGKNRAAGLHRWPLQRWRLTGVPMEGTRNFGEGVRSKRCSTNESFGWGKRQVTIVNESS